MSGPSNLVVHSRIAKLYSTYLGSIPINQAADRAK
jgi:hypothetical protein